MPVIAVVNRKGGSGKSTLATHLAAYSAHAGLPVMLGDVDQQQSTQSWLRLRAAQGDAKQPAIRGWKVEPSRGLRPPAGTTHVVLDTPGGLTGFELARLVVFCDAIVMPVCHSVFDLDSAAQCLAELKSLPRVANGRCQLAVVGMRVDPSKQSLRRLRQWCEAQGVPLVTALRDTPAYVRCIEQGQTLFDLPARHVQADLQQWDPLLKWLAPVWKTGTAPAAEPAAANATADQASAPVVEAAPVAAAAVPAMATSSASASASASTPASAATSTPSSLFATASTSAPSADLARPIPPAARRGAPQTTAEPSLHAFYATPGQGPSPRGTGLSRLWRGWFDKRQPVTAPAGAQARADGLRRLSA